jgi:integrase
MSSRLALTAGPNPLWESGPPRHVKGTLWASASLRVLGLRPGECLGLRWSDIDFKAETLTVRHVLKRDRSLGHVKNDGSRRQLPLPESCVPALMAWMATQAAEQEKAGEYWQNSDDLVFTTSVGSPVSDRNLRNRSGRSTEGKPCARTDFAYICEQAGVGKWDLHECRHTAATIMLLNKVPIEVVSKVLGHRSIRQTADVCSHLLPASSRRLSRLLTPVLHADTKPATGHSNNNALTTKSGPDDLQSNS